MFARPTFAPYGISRLFFSAFSSWDSNFCTYGIQPGNHEKLLFKTAHTFAHLCTFGIQSENQEKRFLQASQPRRRNQKTAATQRGLQEVEKRRCTQHAALTGRVGTAQIQKMKSSNAGQSARVVQRSFFSASAYSASTSCTLLHLWHRSVLKI